MASAQLQSAVLEVARSSSPFPAAIELLSCSRSDTLARRLGRVEIRAPGRIGVSVLALQSLHYNYCCGGSGGVEGGTGVRSCSRSGPFCRGSGRLEVRAPGRVGVSVLGLQSSVSGSGSGRVENGKSVPGLYCSQSCAAVGLGRGGSARLVRASGRLEIGAPGRIGVSVLGLHCSHSCRRSGRVEGGVVVPALICSQSCAAAGLGSRSGSRSGRVGRIRARGSYGIRFPGFHCPQPSCTARAAAKELLSRRSRSKREVGECRISVPGLHWRRGPAVEAKISRKRRLREEGFGRMALTSDAGNGRPPSETSGSILRGVRSLDTTFKGEHAPSSVEDWEVPSEEFRRTALVSSKQKYDAMYKRSIEDPDSFWGEIASQFFWKTRWDVRNGKIHSANLDVRQGPIHVEWFRGGKTNICFNAVDRHVEAGKGEDTALIWEGNEPGDDGKLTYGELRNKVCQLSNYMRSLGVVKGDAVVIYMPMVLELPVAMLACARMGAVHSVVFAGFSAESLAQRILDCKPKILLTANGVMRGPKLINLKEIVDDALVRAGKGGYSSAGPVLVYANDVAMSKEATAWHEGRDVWWQDVVPVQPTESEIEWVDAEDPLFLLYTSGSTGKPKGVLHTTGGYMVWTATTFKYAFDYHAGEIFWCTADCGWITGHSYLTYGPLLNGATVVAFEGIPTYPDEGRCWEIVDKYKVDIFYTAPTAIRSLMRAGDGPVKRYSRKSLKVLGSVGEPINPSAWRWYYDVVGDGRCPISDTWWQTETGGFMITPLPGAWPLKPGSATFPFFGVQPAIVDENGKELQGECSGYLCIKAPWPGSFRTLYGDHARYETTYFAPFKGFYFSGDGCHRDKDGYYWLTGRVDDVINVSGHRIGSAEVESALVSHPQCTEAAVVGYDHEVKGQGIYAFVTLIEGVAYSAELRKQLVATVRAQIGPFAAPDRIHWAPGLPKTRSGKIMRRILRKIAANEIDGLGDVSTLADPGVVDQLIALRDK